MPSGAFSRSHGKTFGKGDTGFAETMLIAHSGYAGEEHFQRVKQAGFDHYLVKPASIARLNELITSLSDPENRPHRGS